MPLTDRWFLREFGSYLLNPLRRFSGYGSQERDFWFFTGELANKDLTGLQELD